jgi:diguanylate cyclase (GGDEF)-like protein/PAS domain S-box-containing protein
VGSARPSRKEGATRAPGLESDLGLLEPLPDGVLLCDARGRIVYANRRLAAMTGYDRDVLVGRQVEVLVPEGLRAAHRRDRRGYQARPRARPMGAPDRDFAVRRADGTTFPADIALGPLERAGGKQVIAIVRDITDRKRLEAAVAHRALHDPLTGLANRTLFFDRLRQAMLQARRDRRQVALVMLDLDQFKSVNDAHGHQAGDEVLRKAGQRLSKGLRRTDTVARIGGDEFAWVLPGVSGRQAAAVMMAKLLRAVSARFSVDGKAIEVGVSAGLAMFPDDGDDVDALMRVADVELYAAKRHAPTRVPTRRRAGA